MQINSVSFLLFSSVFFVYLFLCVFFVVVIIIVEQINQSLNKYYSVVIPEKKNILT